MQGSLSLLCEIVEREWFTPKRQDGVTLLSFSTFSFFIFFVIMLDENVYVFIFWNYFYCFLHQQVFVFNGTPTVSDFCN